MRRIDPGRNAGRDTKFSVVFTYHDAANRPLPGTRSASLPDVPLRAPEQTSAARC